MQKHNIEATNHWRCESRFDDVALVDPVAIFGVSLQGQHGAVAASSPAAQNHVAVPGPGANRWVPDGLRNEAFELMVVPSGND